MICPAKATIGLLLSGGLDSTALLCRYLEEGRRVQPFYVRSDVAWADTEQKAVERLVQVLARPQLASLVTFRLPLADLYGLHWSVTGEDVPGADTPDEAVFLPGRNLLLVMKAAIWCQMHGIEELALAPLSSNPFPDATPGFFISLERTLALAGPGAVRLLRPLSSTSKSELIRLARDYPLELSFSCIAPVADQHCGVCNKCAERKTAFEKAEIPDPTEYAAPHAGGPVFGRG
jgi:7-cyano-7-deazaguanine synthase